MHMPKTSLKDVADLMFLETFFKFRIPDKPESGVTATNTLHASSKNADQVRKQLQDAIPTSLVYHNKYLERLTTYLTPQLPATVVHIIFDYEIESRFRDTVVKHTNSGDLAKYIDQIVREMAPVVHKWNPAVWTALYIPLRHLMRKSPIVYQRPVYSYMVAATFDAIVSTVTSDLETVKPNEAMSWLEILRNYSDQQVERLHRIQLKRQLRTPKATSAS